MTENQAVRVLEKADKFQKAVNNRKQAERDLRKSPNEKTIKKFGDAAEVENQANNDLMDTLADITPRGIWETLRVTMQGNLLTPISQVANITGNLSMLPARGAASAVARSADAIWAAVTGGKRSFGNFNLSEGASGSLEGLEQSIEGLVDPGAATDSLKGEVQRGFRPLRAWATILHDADAPTKLKIEKAIEGTFGVPAEVMFRALNVGDKPFRRAAEAMYLNEQADLKGLEGADRTAFVLAPDAKSKREAKEAGDRAVFAQETALSRTVERTLGAIREVHPGLNFAVRTVMPYVRTPAGIITETMMYVVPDVTGVIGVYQLIKGRRKEGLNNLGKAAVGKTVWLVAGALIEKGLLGPGADDEADKRNLQYEIHPPNTLNVSGLERALDGGSPEPRTGDTFVRYEKMGVIGAIFHIASNNSREDNEAMLKGEFAADQPRGVLQDLTGVMALARFAVDQSFLAGTASLMKALTTPGQEEMWLANYFNTVTAIPVPNTVMSMARAKREFIPDARDETWTGRLKKQWDSKLAGIGFDEPDLPLKRNLWGNPIPQTPESANPVVYNMFDVFKTRDLEDKPVSLEVYKLYHETGNASAIPNPPARTLQFRGQSLKLTPEQYDRFSQLVGQERHRMAEAVVLDPRYIPLDSLTRINVLSKQYSRGYSRGKALFLQELGQ